MVYQNRQQQQEEIIRQILEQQQQYEYDRTNRENLLKSANNIRGKIGNYGYAFSKSNNPVISNIGNKIYNYSGQNALNSLKSNANNSIQTGIQNLGNKFGIGQTANTPGTLVGTSGTNAGIEAANTLGTTAAETAGEALAGTAAESAATGALAETAVSEAAASGAATTAAGASATIPVAGWIAALAMLAANNQRQRSAKREQEDTEESYQDMAKNIQSNTDRKMKAMQNIQNSTNQNSDFVHNTNTDNNGNFTGGAAPVVDNIMSQYQDYLRQNGYDENTVNGVSQGLNNGYKEIADWQNQYLQSKDGQNANFRIPQTEEEIALAREGNFNIPNSVQNGGIVETDKKNWIDNIVNGIMDFSKGYSENRNTPFSPNNLKPNDNKNKMTRLGEAFGTTSRMLQSPAAQALAAGLITKQLTGDNLAAVSNAYKFGGNRAMSNIYNQVLREQGIDIPTNTFSNLQASDVNTLMNPQYKKAANNIALANLEEQKNYHETMADLKRQQNESLDAYRNSNIKIKQQNADTQAYKAKNGTTVNHKGSSNKKAAAKPQNHEDWNSDLSGFTKIMTDPKYIDKTDEARARFINKYGVDPMKYIKL